ALTLSFTLLRRRGQPPCQGVAIPTAGVAALAGGSPLRTGRWRPPLAGAPWAASYGLAAGGRPLQARRWQSPLRASRSRPCPRVAAPSGLLPLRAAAPCRWPAAPL
ncbi:hypothetical protein BHE74_00056468, partial [Ensete ventricosum]